MGSMHSQPKLSIQSEVPVVALHLDEDLRGFILGALPCNEETALERFGFEQCVDHRNCLEHKYLEGYFHGLGSFARAAVPSMHPRYGTSLSRRPAPLELLAFCEATRRVNVAFFNQLCKDLAKVPSARKLQHAILNHGHFADISVQVHWGEQIPETQANWHIDGPNSSLHLALSLQGERTLLAKRNVPCARDISDADHLLQREGSVYLSSPCCYPHAVQYPEASWERRVIAVQCRVLLEANDTCHQLDMIDIDSKGKTMQTMMSHVAQSQFFLPTLDLVQKIMSEFEATGVRSAHTKSISSRSTRCPSRLSS